MYGKRFYVKYSNGINERESPIEIVGYFDDKRLFVTLRFEVVCEQDDIYNSVRNNISQNFKQVRQNINQGFANTDWIIKQQIQATESQIRALQIQQAQQMCNTAAVYPSYMSWNVPNSMYCTPIQYYYPYCQNGYSTIENIQNWRYEF